MATYPKPNLQGWTAVGSQVFEVFVKTSAGVEYDLTGMTVTVSGTLDSVDQFRDLACTLSATPVDGSITFTPDVTEIPTAGTLECQLKIDNSGAIALPFGFTLTLTNPV
jgi:hypothetical protein